MEILDRLTSPNDIKSMSIKELYELCEDLRSFMLSKISKTGGHLASNLGVVEITVAIHNVFDTSRDRLVFDVGHQCYAHKILTGRREGFDNLRALGGISGFPNPEESGHDAFISGHASTSVSVALGMARARTAMGEDYSVIAVIGDGALTGGLAYEGLSDAGHSGEPLIVILNDNEMSITENVGGLSMHLAHLRTRHYYLTVKKIYRKTIAKIPFLGKWLTYIMQSIKLSLKDALRLPSSMFENMGFQYLGPTDGHNIKEVCRLLKVADKMAKPVIIHLRTVKGKGYKYAEQSPEAYHGVSSFNVSSGEPVEANGNGFSSAFGKALSALAEKDKRVCAVTAAMQTGTGLDGFAERYPAQFFDVGIAEAHAVTMAGGLAKQGMLPVCAIYSTFVQRAYDMVFHDVCLTNLHVVFAVDRAGLVSEEGQTHQGTYDVGIFLQMPNMTVLCPSDISEIAGMLRYAVYELRGPVAIRYPRGGSNNGMESAPPYGPVPVREGSDVAIASYGRTVANACDAAKLLEKQGISAAVVKVTDISAITVEKLAGVLGGFRHSAPDAKSPMTIFVVEECVQAGCLASKLALEASAAASAVRIVPVNLGKSVPQCASTAELMHMYGLDAEGIAKIVGGEEA